MNASTTPSVQRPENVHRHAHENNRNLRSTSPNTNVANEKPLADSHSSSQSPPRITRKRPRRYKTSSSDSETETITGHVLSTGKFQCSHPDCEELRFGRQADFRRHCSQVHVLEKIEYFCTVVGCQRSRKPNGGSKGRSFGMRKDKMEEHVRTVHCKRVKKRKVNEEDEENGWEESSEKSEDENHKKQF